MTVTLTYDPALARVRLSADGLGAADYATIERSTDQIRWTTVRGGVAAPIAVRADLRHTFSTVAASSWPNADTGQVLTASGGTAANFSSDGSRGFISVASLNVDRFVDSGLSLADFDITGEVQSPVTPTGDNFEIKIRGRYVDANNFVGARFFLAPAGTVSCSLQQVVGGSETNAGFPSVPGVTATSVIAYRLQGSGNLIRFKGWLSGTAEPAAWTTAMTTTHTTAGSVRVGNLFGSSVSNVLPVAIAYDNLIVGPRVATVDDYEFVSGQANYYRVRGIESSAIEFVGAGTAATANNASVAPAHPSAQLLPRDLKLVLSSIRNSGTGTVNTPTDWTLVRAFGNVALLGKYHVAGDSAPTVTFAGGAANADTFGQMAVWRRADLTPVTGADLLNGSAQNVNHPALTMPEDDLLAVIVAWKQDDTSGVTALAGMTEVGEASSTTGLDASQAWDQVIQTLATDIAAGTFTFGGGAAAISRAMAVAFRHAAYLNEQTANLTPVLDRIWLKSVTRPFLNRAVTVVDWSPEERPSRNGGFPVVGRTLEVGVTDVAGGLVFDLDLHVSNRDDAQTLDYIRASGDILYLHIPAGCEVPGGHVCVDTTSARRVRARGSSRVFTLPLRQCAAPAADVVGATSTWQTVLNSYATWAAVLAANPTWADLLARVAAPSEVIVP